MKIRVFHRICDRYEPGEADAIGATSCRTHDQMCACRRDDDPPWCKRCIKTEQEYQAALAKAGGGRQA